MSSLKTAMKDRLAIVMRNICTYYDACSFERKTVVPNLEIIRMITNTNASEDTTTPFVSPGTLWTVSVTKLGYFNMSFGELCEKFMSSASANDPRFAQN